MTLTIVPPYAALLALLFAALVLRVVRARRAGGVALGVAGPPGLERAVRAHANFAEHVPLALLLLAMAELRGAAPWALHPLCLLLLAGRLAHARGIAREPEDFRFRVAGVGATLTVLVAGALLLLLGGPPLR